MDAKEFYEKFYASAGKTLPTDPSTRHLVEQVLRDGFVVIPDAFSASEAREAIRETERLHGDAPKTGRVAFDGFKTNRILALLGKTRVFDKFCLLPQVRALNDFFLDEDYNFYIVETIVINPGESRQVLHHDDAVTSMRRPRAPATIGTMIVLEDYTEMNGATRVIPGSHLWGSDRRGKDEEARTVTCKAGSVVYFLGTLWHSGGANRTDKPRYAATVQYCQPWIRPLENLMFAIDPRRALSGEIPRPIVDMMGYKTAFPFIGYADGLNPRKAAGRLVRWLQAPVDKNPPTFASEPGEREKMRSRL